MNVQEKQAWFTLAIFAITLVLYGSLVSVVGFRMFALSAFGFSGFAAFAALIGRRERKAGRVVMDERDEEIARMATLAGYSGFWLVFVATLMAPFFVLGPNGVVNIPVGLLCMLPILAMIIVWTVRSLAVVIAYRWGDHGESK